MLRTRHIKVEVSPWVATPAMRHAAHFENGLVTNGGTKEDVIATGLHTTKMKTGKDSPQDP